MTWEYCVKFLVELLAKLYVKPRFFVIPSKCPSSLMLSNKLCCRKLTI